MLSDMIDEPLGTENKLCEMTEKVEEKVKYE